jgi:hypothetical protein
MSSATLLNLLCAKAAALAGDQAGQRLVQKLLEAAAGAGVGVRQPNGMQHLPVQKPTVCALPALQYNHMALPVFGDGRLPACWAHSPLSCNMAASIYLIHLAYTSHTPGCACAGRLQSRTSACWSCG